MSQRLKEENTLFVFFRAMITHHVFSTLCSSQNESRVWHVIAQVYVRPSAQNTPSFLQWDIGFNGNGVCSDHRPVGSALALNFTTFCVPEFNTGAFDKTHYDCGASITFKHNRQMSERRGELPSLKQLHLLTKSLIAEFTQRGEEFLEQLDYKATWNDPLLGE